MKIYHLKCYICGKKHTEKESVTHCLYCGGPIEIYYDYEKISQKLNLYSLKNAPISTMKYAMFYPIDNFKNIISLEEGGTPLIHVKNLGKKYNLKNLYIKNEGVNPTGAFKDRGTLVEVTKAKEMGAKAICLASAGNMAASVAAYASAAKIPCYVLIPEGTPIGKLSQSLSFGARVLQVRDTYSKCAEMAEEMAKRFGFYLAGDYAFRVEGQKSEGYEIIEQLFWKSPDYIVCPIGCGTNFHAIYKGIKEFYNLGFTDKMPKLIGVQTQGCNPIIQAFKNNEEHFKIFNHPNTIASAIAVGDPLDGKKILDDIYESKGHAVDVSDEFLLNAQQEQAKMTGIFSEPSGALAFAAVKKLTQDKFFKEDDTIVCIATASGLKDPKSPLAILSEPASIEPKFSEIEKFIEQKLYAIKENIPENKAKMIFKKSPQSAKELYVVLKQEFGIDLPNSLAQKILEEINNFLAKGKNIRRSDLQYIVEEVLNEIDLTEKVLEIKDFYIHTSLHKKAGAKIFVKLFNKDMELAHEGVGPIDATIKALGIGLKNHDKLKVRLVDYEVGIDSKGVSSTVEVKMTLFDKHDNKVVAKASSPDVIVASIRAFEKGFNILYAKNELH